jgi:2,3-bisphosphoglycerate-independent phosphoglycerate mutase
MHTPKPLVLCILDGWGHTHNPEQNAIANAKAPNWNRYWRDCPHSLLQASELHVGLPDGQMGNSEVGHMNIGAGRIVMQELPRINQAIRDGSLATHPRLQQFIDTLKQSGGTCHLMGLMSPGGVHSHQEHLATLANLVATAGVPVVVHAFTDGRDTPPKSARGYLETFLSHTTTLRDKVSIGTVIGRYYAMDRDKRWDRLEKAYRAMVLGDCPQKVSDAVSAIEYAYAADTTDEFILPTLIGDYTGMKDGDGVLMGNFRADRARQLLHALLDPAFDGFTRERVIHFADTIGLVEYSSVLNAFIPALFEQQSLANGLGETISKAGKKQLRIAETEKYAHVTFFFNGGEEVEYAGESRILVPSPKVATYDLKPEMSAFEVTEHLEKAIAAGTFDLIVVNYANGDMVGHSGNLEAATKAVEAVDTCLGRLEAALNKAGGAMLITADHGNAEQMQDPHTYEPHTAHTVNPVPFVLVSANQELQQVTLTDGVLADIAPTVLTFLNLPIPREMTGKVLVSPPDAARKHG